MAKKEKLEEFAFVEEPQAVEAEVEPTEAVETVVEAVEEVAEVPVDATEVVYLRDAWTAELRPDGVYNIYDRRHVLQVVGASLATVENFK